MKKKSFYKSVFIALLLISSVSEGSDSKETDLSQMFIDHSFKPMDEIEKKKYNFSICAILSSYPTNLQEWIEYHRLIGVNHFYLYNNTGRACDHPFLDFCCHNNIVTMINWPMPCLKKDNQGTWALSTQVPAFENVIKLKAAKESKWLIFMELDEYLVPILTDSLTELLNIYEDKPALTLSHLCFKKTEKVNKKRFVIENVMLTKDAPIIEDRSVSKTIFKPDESIGFTWSPYKCILKNGQSDFKIESDQLCINQYLENSSGSPESVNRKNKIVVDRRSISENDVTDLLSNGYELEDQEKAILRFVPRLKKRMSRYAIE